MNKQQRENLSRRSFAGILGGTAAAAPLLAQQNTQAAPAQTSTERRGSIPDIPAFEKTLVFTRRDIPAQAHPFPMTQVRLLDGTFKDLEEWNRAYMLRLAPDRLIRNFRINAGLPSSAEPLGGWEQDTPGRAGELRGHFTGHYLSAVALMYASTGDKEMKSRGDYMVAELAKCQQKLSGGYLSAFPTEWFDRLDARKPVWAPFYTIHKIMAGMLDQYQFAGNAQALEVLQAMASWADNWTAPKPELHMQEILETEYGGMNEVLYNLAAITNDERWAKTGDRFTKKRFFNPLASHRDELRGLHANTHIPQVIGAARRYEISGDMRFHDLSDFFWYEIATARSYVTGGTSNGEGWLTAPRQLAAELKRSVATAECCCSYNMLKLTRHLYSWNQDPRYFDYYERTLLNERLGTIRPQIGTTQYYPSLTPGAWRTFATEDRSFWCCNGTGIEEYSKLNDSIYWHDDQGLYVNLFIASELNWPEKSFRLRQLTRFPEQANTTLLVSVDRPIHLDMRLRIPEWLTSGASIRINGKALDASASPGSYLIISRTWRNGDRVDFEMPMRLRIEAMPDDPTLQAVLYGPVVLAGDLGSTGLTPDMIVGPNAPRPQRIPIDIPVFRAASSDPNSWIKPAGKLLNFNTTGQEKNLSLAPFYTMLDKRYAVYWNVS